MIEEITDKTNKLEQIFAKQLELQQRLGYTRDTMFGNQQFINVMTIAAVAELMEAIHETPWKPWKQHQDFNVWAFREELVDAWHFLLNLSIAAGLDADTLFSEYMAKNKVNFKRQDDGY
jgi:dimeric dUTPase (all-alpha-NTP-PPase superfamily)